MGRRTLEQRITGRARGLWLTAQKKLNQEHKNTNFVERSRRPRLSNLKVDFDRVPVGFELLFFADGCFHRQQVASHLGIGKERRLPTCCSNRRCDLDAAPSTLFVCGPLLDVGGIFVGKRDEPPRSVPVVFPYRPSEVAFKHWSIF